MSYTSASHLMTRDNSWLRSLEFYQTELGILENRLAEVANKNTSMDARAGVEHFQNQFIVQRNNIDELKHEIKEHDHMVYEDARHHEGKVDLGRVSQNERIHDSVKSFEKVVNELRLEFNQFVSKWM